MSSLKPEEEIDATYWRILRQAMLTALTKPLGKRPSDFTLAQQNELLDGLESAMLGTMAQLREVGRQHYLLGVQRVHADLHGQEGVDHEMLDEVVEFRSREPEETQPIELD